MSNYLPSNKVKVFPFGNERIHDPLSRTLNEFNISTIIKMLTTQNKYVVSYNNNIIDFVIDGYYFSADLSDIISTFDTSDNIYTTIRVSSDELSTYSSLEGNDFYVNITGDGKDSPYILAKGVTYFRISEETKFSYTLESEESSLTLTTFELDKSNAKTTIYNATNADNLTLSITVTPDNMNTTVIFDDGNGIINNKFSGLDFSTENLGNQSLLLLSKQDDSWVVPQTSWLRYDPKLIRSTLSDSSNINIIDDAESYRIELDNTKQELQNLHTELDTTKQQLTTSDEELSTRIEQIKDYYFTEIDCGSSVELID